MNPTPTPIHSGRRRRGFTLIEVICSLALVVIIIYGVNKVFALTSEAVGLGQAVSEMNRNARNAQSIIFNDLSSADIDRAPFFIIRSTSIAAFRNRADQLADLDYAATMTSPSDADRTIRTVDRSRNGNETDVEDNTPRTVMNSRMHRADALMFFVRRNARRQTGNVGTFSSAASSGEQYVVYAHIRQPNVATDETAEGRDPGIGELGTSWTPTTNANNFYANQFILGRRAVLMREPNAAGNIVDQNGVSSVYYRRTTGIYTPLQFDSTATDGTQYRRGLYDMAGISMANYRSVVADLPGTGASAWYKAYTEPSAGNGFRPTGFPAPIRPLSQAGAARTVPCFLPQCTQFAVEFAGDFVAQSANGTVTGYAGQPNKTPAEQTDGVVDFCVNPTTGTRQIRWYGFPRDTNDDGRILTKVSGGVAGVTDVIPLRDVVRSVDSGFAGFAFECDLDNKFRNDTPDDYAVGDGVAVNRVYQCAWSPHTAGLPRPTMIRITIALDDAQSRIADEQTYEFVTTLP